MNSRDMQKEHNTMLKFGFTLLELLIVIGIIGMLASFILVSAQTAREAAYIASVAAAQREFKNAVEIYNSDMGFYPPEVNRGWDPGLVQKLPWNADAAAGSPPTGSYATAGINCGHCPSNWNAILDTSWHGPYLNQWLRFTPWRGKYDYNYWATGATRGSCAVPAGIYIGVEPDYDENNGLPQSVENTMIQKSYDFEQCVNGESQFILRGL